MAAWTLRHSEGPTHADRLHNRPQRIIATASSSNATQYPVHLVASDHIEQPQASLPWRHIQ